MGRNLHLVLHEHKGLCTHLPIPHASVSVLMQIVPLLDSYLFILERVDGSFYYLCQFIIKGIVECLEKICNIHFVLLIKFCDISFSRNTSIKINLYLVSRQKIYSQIPCFCKNSIVPKMSHRDLTHRLLFK